MLLSKNYRFLLDKCISMMSDSSCPAVILDYGCGKGDFVKQSTSNKIDAYGVELFAQGSGVDIKDSLYRDKLLRNKVKEIENGVIPFPDAYFDIIVSNTVFEHIPDITPVLSEIERVLKPNGSFINIFPYMGTIREGHCNIPFVHYFKSESKLQYYWLYIFKIFGFGRRKKEKDPAVWAKYFCGWLKDNTFYLSIPEIHDAYAKHGLSIRHIEDEYIHFRLQNSGYFLLSKIFDLSIMKPVSRWLCRKYGGVIIEAKRLNDL